LLDVKCLERQGLVNANVRIAIPTCDKYVDIIPLMLRMLYRSWPGLRSDVCVVYTNTRPDVSGYDNVSCFGIGGDYGWIKNMAIYLSSLDHDDIILLLLDDYLLVDVDAALVRLAERQFVNDSVDAVRLVPTPGPTLPWDGVVGEIDKKSPYSISLQATLWRPSGLLRILKHAIDDGLGSPWDLEIGGSRRLASWRDVGHILGLKRGAMGYINYYRNGGVDPKAAAVLETYIGG